MLTRRNSSTVLAAAALTLGLLGSLGAAWSPADGAAPRAPHAATHAARAEAKARVIDFVATGDSYSAGPLIPVQRQDPLGCLRSTNNYPAYLAGFLQVSTYRDVTCSGALTRDYRKPQTTIVPGPSPAPQLQALSKASDIVTVGIGGNDYTLFGEMTSVCPRLAQKHPNGHPCKTHFTNSRGVNTKYRDARRIRHHIARTLVKVHRHAPNARVYVVGYPRLLPTTGFCTAPAFARGDFAFGRRVEHFLNRSLRRAAVHHRAHYINLYPASKGHDVCAGSRAWINGSSNTATAAAYHPYQKGERGMGRAVYHQMTGKRAPTGGDAMPPPGSIVLNPPYTG